MDRYWNGSKSLHKNYKFLGAANQLISQHNELIREQEAANNGSDGDGGESSNIRSLHIHLKNLQDENRCLQQTLLIKNAVKSSSSSAASDNNENHNNQAANEFKTLLVEIVIIFYIFLFL